MLRRKGSGQSIIHPLAKQPEKRFRPLKAFQRKGWKSHFVNL